MFIDCIIITWATLVPCKVSSFNICCPVHFIASLGGDFVSKARHNLFVSSYRDISIEWDFWQSNLSSMNVDNEQTWCFLYHFEFTQSLVLQGSSSNKALHNGYDLLTQYPCKIQWNWKPLSLRVKRLFYQFHDVFPYVQITIVK